VAIFLTAVALQRACTLPWGHGTAADRTPYELSVVGLSRLPTDNGSPRVDCRWWPRYGDAALCSAPTTGAPAHASLRLAYPLLQVALWLSVASLLLQALRVPRHRLVQGALPALVAGLTTTAVVYMVRGAEDGLAALDGVAISFSDAGAIFAVGAAALSALSAGILLTSFIAPRPVDATPTTANQRPGGTAREPA
jgi:hypothetical protein